MSEDNVHKATFVTRRHDGRQSAGEQEVHRMLAMGLNELIMKSQALLESLGLGPQEDFQVTMVMRQNDSWEDCMVMTTDECLHCVALLVLKKHHESADLMEELEEAELQRSRSVH